MFSKNKGLAKTNSKELLLNKSGVNSGGKGTEREESMAGKERLMAIRQTIQTQKKASVGELSKICRVTEETIRRDLDKLEADGVVTRVHGGAIWNEGIQKEGVHFYRRMSKHLKEKQEIARKTAKLFEGKTTMIADSSTTVMEALKLLPQSPDITVVTNSTEVFREFQQSPLNIISTGGEYNKKSLSLPQLRFRLNQAHLFQCSVGICEPDRFSEGELHYYRQESFRKVDRVLLRTRD